MECVTIGGQATSIKLVPEVIPLLQKGYSVYIYQMQSTIICPRRKQETPGYNRVKALTGIKPLQYVLFSMYIIGPENQPNIPPIRLTQDI